MNLYLYDIMGLVTEIIDDCDTITEIENRTNKIIKTIEEMAKLNISFRKNIEEFNNCHIKQL